MVQMGHSAYANRADKLCALPRLNTASVGTSPIAVPRRNAIHPPPCSPLRDQNSPEFVFDFEFSVSPEASDITAPLFLQNQGATARLFPLQQKANSYLPLSALASNTQGSTHPYAHEPFLYTVPKVPLRDTQNIHRDTIHGSVVDSGSTMPTLDYGVSSPPGRVPSGSSIPSLSSAPSFPPSADVSMELPGEEQETHPLTAAFRKPLVSASILSSSTSWSSHGSMFSAYQSPPQSPTASSTPPKSRSRQLLPNRSKALQRTAAAAPVVSLNVAQAERPCYSSHGRSPYAGIAKPRARRTSSVGTGQSLEKIREPSRRMSTVVGRGAGRVVSLAENRSGSGMSLVSDEDIEQSLEKDNAEVVVHSRGRSLSRRRREEFPEELPEKGSRGETEPERGRSRGRVPLRGPAAPSRIRALPGWQWTDAH